MLEDLKSAQKVMGAKQVGRALKSGQASLVFLAKDADLKVTEPIEALCREQSVPVETVESMSRLGAHCGISVGSAVAAIVK